jgi:4-amino-4-deoxy-L-arabinose transferase-like glycosyltransferase
MAVSSAKLPRGEAWLVVVALAWLGVTIGLRPLTLPDEGRYASVAWEMLRSGDWVVPTLDGLPYFHKPPLFYWIAASVMAVAGPSHAAVRLPPLIGAATALIAAWAFARRWMPGTSRPVLAVLATSPLFFFGAQFANLDMLVAGCITATTLAFAHAALLSPDADRRSALAAGYLFAALGVLAKGLIGIVLPGLVLVVWLLLARRWREPPRWLWLPGIALFALATVPWFAAVQARYPAFLHYFFVVQHFERYASSGFNNPQPAWFYIAVLTLLVMPWTVALWPALRSAWMERGGPPPRRLLWLWVALITLFFSVPHSKLVGYIFPVVPALALLIAAAVARTWRPWQMRAATALGAVACLAAVATLTVRADRSQADIGQALRERVQASDAVFFVDGYWFAVPFEARLSGPVQVVMDWSAPGVGSRDNWQRELLDAAQLAPDLHRLAMPHELEAHERSGAVSWIVAPSDAAQAHPLLRMNPPVASAGALALWRFGPGG